MEGCMEEKNINREAKLSKMLLNFEYVLIFLGMATFITLLFVVCYVDLKLVFKILILVYAFIQLFALCFCCIIIEQKAGYYECKHCGHKYVPTFKQAFCAMHMGRTKYMKCPKCGEKSWQKKVIE